MLAVTRFYATLRHYPGRFEVEDLAGIADADVSGVDASKKVHGQQMLDRSRLMSPRQIAWPDR